MKKLAIAIALSCMTAGAFAMPTLYGTLDVSVDQSSEKLNNSKSLSETHVHSNSSFIGIKGDVELNNRLSAIYQADWVVFADGDNRDFSNRTRFVGLKDKQLGTIKVGQQDTAVKTLSGAVDVFNARAGGKLDVESIMLGETRLSNAIVYETPKITMGNGGLVVTGVLTTGEGTHKTTNSKDGTNYVASRGISGSFSTSAVYSNDNFLVGVGYDKNIPSLFAPKKAVGSTDNVYGVADTVRVVGRAKVVDNLVLKGLYQHSKAGSKTAVNTNQSTATTQISKATLNKAEGWLVGAEYTVPQTPVTVKASYSENVTDYKTMTDLKAQQIAAGVDYSFNKQVKAYGQVGQVQYKEGAKKDKVTLGGVGMEYKF